MGFRSNTKDQTRDRKADNEIQSLWARVIRAIYGDDGQVGKVSKVGSRSCWRNIVNEVRFLGNQGVKVLDYMRIKLGNGESTAFWDDNWIGGKVLKYSFPCIYALETVKEVSVNSKMSDSRWVWSLEGSGEFSVASIQKIIDDNRLSTMDTKTLWNKCVPIKVNILAWKIKIEALPTRFNISRKGIDIDSILCPICECGVESARHVFFSCSFVRQIVRKVCSWWDIMHIDVNSYVEWVNWMNSLRLKSKSKLMIEGVFYVVWWHVWTFRNKLLFEDKKPLKAIIFDDVVSRSYYWCHTFIVEITGTMREIPSHEHKSQVHLYSKVEIVVVRGLTGSADDSTATYPALSRLLGEEKVETTSASYQASVRGEPARSPVQRIDDGKTWFISKAMTRHRAMMKHQMEENDQRELDHHKGYDDVLIYVVDALLVEEEIISGCRRLE
ncbi:RNA-directed DNA polymerase, eukaryota [Tanacetum coccineum]